MRFFAILVLISSSHALASGSFGVGQKDFVLQDASRQRRLVTHVWYPIDAKTKLMPVAEKRNPFVPVVSARNAALISFTRQLPVVLLSHGSGGKADKLFWVTDYLVKQGAVVIGVDHPGNMTGDNSADGMMRVWDRPKDLSFALDEVSQKPEFKSRLNLKQVAAVGHSAGGTTVLMLAGARLSYANFQSPVPKCEGTKDPWYARLCGQLKSLDLRNYPKETVEGNYADPRVRTVVAYDPGLFRSFEPKSLKAIESKIHILIADKLNAPQDEIYSKEFAGLLPAERAQIIPNSFHMTFLSACKPAFPKDDPELAELCINNDQKFRIQQEVAEKTWTFIRKGWSD